MSIEEMRAALSAGGQSETDCIRWIYQKYAPLIVGFLSKKGVLQQAAEDICMEVVINFIEQLRFGNLGASASVNSYLYARTRHAWRKFLGKK